MRDEMIGRQADKQERSRLEVGAFLLLNASSHRLTHLEPPATSGYDSGMTAAVGLAPLVENPPARLIVHQVAATKSFGHVRRSLWQSEDSPVLGFWFD